MCSIFSQNVNGQIVVGRNFDWIQLGGNVHFIPPKRRYGLMTYGLCLVEQFGSDRPWEGMNSQGLFMGVTGIHSKDFPPRKPNHHSLRLDEFGAIRFVLERASSTQQAVAILDQANIVPQSIEPHVRLQYFIVDKDGEFCIIAGQEKTPLQNLDDTTGAAITSFPLSLQDNVVTDRLMTLQQTLPHVIHETDAMALIESVSTELTVYSCLYSLTQKTMRICIEQDFQTATNFRLDQEIDQQETVKGHQVYNFGQLKLRRPEYRERSNQPQQKVQPEFVFNQLASIKRKDIVPYATVADRPASVV